MRQDIVSKISGALSVTSVTLEAVWDSQKLASFRGNKQHGQYTNVEVTLPGFNASHALGVTPETLSDVADLAETLFDGTCSGVEAFGTPYARAVQLRDAATQIAAAAPEDTV